MPALPSASIAEFQHCCVPALLRASIAECQHCRVPALLRASIAERQQRPAEIAAGQLLLPRTASKPARSHKRPVLALSFAFSTSPPMRSCYSNVLCLPRLPYHINLLLSTLRFQCTAAAARNCPPTICQITHTSCSNAQALASSASSSQGGAAAGQPPQQMHYESNPMPPTGSNPVQPVGNPVILRPMQSRPMQPYPKVQR